jgi:hypothetical protein
MVLQPYVRGFFRAPREKKERTDLPQATPTAETLLLTKKWQLSMLQHAGT